MKHKAFSLIELLVAVSIITLLIAILLPSLHRAKEMARRAACAAHLHGLQLATVNYASSNELFYPKSYRNWKSKVPRPHFFNDAHPGDVSYFDEDAAQPQIFGTPWEVLTEFGVNDASVICPSAGRKPLAQHTYLPADWGRFVQMDYAYLVGVFETPYVSSTLFNANRRPPAMWRMTQQKSPAQAVVACDLVYWGGGPAFPWGDQYMINHVGNPADKLPSWQYVVCADGHVDGENTYTQPLENNLAGGNNYCLRQASDGAFFYWQGTP
ncbi:MAG: prepilin-type N-terminal cleavage/methylation domain-containing protein [Planctomycetes bacterium]|nr:prepilin-type N-terminal cleavage/methylation domain-containing protein [Planctomycetota bacterium]